MMKQASLPNSIQYIASYDYLMEHKCNVDEQNKWTLDDLRILISQGVCYLLKVITEKMISKPENVSDQDLWNKHIGLRLQSLAYLHSIYYNYNSFREAIVMERD